MDFQLQNIPENNKNRHTTQKKTRNISGSSNSTIIHGKEEGSEKLKEPKKQSVGCLLDYLGMSEQKENAKET